MMADNQLLLNNGVGGGDDIFVYTGGDQQVPHDVERVRIAENMDTIPARAFYQRQQLREVEGHNRLRKIEEWAFLECPLLKRVKKMQGVVEIEEYAFGGCRFLREIDFDKLEIIGRRAFCGCMFLNWPSLSLKCVPKQLNLPSIRIIGDGAFQSCRITDAILGRNWKELKRMPSISAKP